ncbi:MAG: MBL fold metallo-hydrolase [Patescibacteria group bacterium]
MIITYHGHSCFKLKGKTGTVITDPYSGVGFTMPSLSADIVTISHDHYDHNNANDVDGTARRKRPFVIEHLGEYEVGGVSVFGTKSFHDGEAGAKAGLNRIYVIVIDGIRVCHLGDLGHELDENLVKEIGDIDVLLLPVGGVYTINAKQAVAVAKALEPSFIVPMHYKTTAHNQEKFGELQELGEFIKEFGVENVEEIDKLKVEKERLPEEKELVIIQRT